MIMGAFWAKSFPWLFRAKSDHIVVTLLCPIKTTLFSLKFVPNMFVLCIDDNGSFLGENLSVTFSNQNWPYRCHPFMPFKTTLFSLKFVPNMFILCIDDNGCFLGEILSVTFLIEKWLYRRHLSMPHQNYSVFAEICPKYVYILYI